MGRRALGFGAVCLAVLASPSSVFAEYNAPSTAGSTTIGVPFGAAFTTDDNGPHWWRLPTVVRPGDSLTLAAEVQIVDSGDESEMRFCLAPPVDDFDATQTAGDCLSDDGRRETMRYGKRRFTLPYTAATGQGFLLVDLSDPTRYLSGTYGITIEAIKRRVLIGLAHRPSSVRRIFALRANLRYGDNSTVPDGTSVRLEWRRGQRRYRVIARRTTTRGGARLRGKLPLWVTGKRVLLRLCSDDSCLAPISVRVRR